MKQNFLNHKQHHDKKEILNNSSLPFWFRTGFLLPWSRSSPCCRFSRPRIRWQSATWLQPHPLSVIFSSYHIWPWGWRVECYRRVDRCRKLMRVGFTFPAPGGCGILFVYNQKKALYFLTILAMSFQPQYFIKFKERKSWRVWVCFSGLRSYIKHSA